MDGVETTRQDREMRSQVVRAQETSNVQYGARYSCRKTSQMEKKREGQKLNPNEFSNKKNDTTLLTVL